MSPLIVFQKSLNEDFLKAYKEPCVVVASHPSLRVGDALHFMNLWKSSQSCTIVLTDPDFAPDDVLAPFQPLSMKSTFCPLDPRLSLLELKVLLTDARPRQLFLPAVYPFTDLVSSAITSVLSMTACTPLPLAVKDPITKVPVTFGVFISHC